MRFGILLSILLHAVVAIVLLWPGLIPWGKLPDVSPEPYIPLDLIAEAELDLTTSAPAAAPEPVEEEQPEPDLPEPVIELPTLGAGEESKDLLGNPVQKNLFGEVVVQKKRKKRY